MERQEPTKGIESGIAAKVQQIRPAVQFFPMQGYEHVRRFVDGFAHAEQSIKRSTTE